MIIHLSSAQLPTAMELAAPSNHNARTSFSPRDNCQLSAAILSYSVSLAQIPYIVAIVALATVVSGRLSSPLRLVWYSARVAAQIGSSSYVQTPQCPQPCPQTQSIFLAVTKHPFSFPLHRSDRILPGRWSTSKS